MSGMAGYAFFRTSSGRNAHPRDYAHLCIDESDPSFVLGVWQLLAKAADKKEVRVKYPKHFSLGVPWRVHC